MIRLKFLKVFVMTVAMMMYAMAVIAGDVFVKLSAETGGDGTSWDKALNAVTFADRFKSLESGTNVYLTEGECVIGNTLQANEKSIILKGGYPDNLSGTEKEYQGYHGKTVLKGNGELSQLLSVYGALEKKVVIENIDFTNARYIVEPAEDKNVVIGALVINNCRNITVRNCNFYDNVSNADNMLRGSVEDEITEGFEDRDNINVKFYRLSYDNNRNAGFFWGAADGGVFTNAAGKAYLVMYPAECGASLARSFTFGGDATSVGGIITGDDNSVKSAWYMLHGIRIKGMPARGGIYIRDGRKVVVR